MHCPAARLEPSSAAFDQSPRTSAGAERLPQPAARGPGGAAPVVHIVDTDEGLRSWLSELFRSAGVEARGYGALGDFDGGACDGPGCLLVEAEHWPEQPDRGKTSPPYPIVVIARSADIRVAVAAMKSGAVDFLKKPLDPEEVLAAAGRAILLHQQRRSAEIRRRELAARYARLTRREREVMELVTSGLMNKQIAWELGLSEITVKVHRGQAMRKMEARTLAELVRMADALEDDPEPDGAGDAVPLFRMQH